MNDLRLMWADDNDKREEPTVTRADLARFAHHKSRRQFSSSVPVTTQPSCSSGQHLQSLLQRQWGDFVTLCQHTTIAAAIEGTTAKVGNVELLEQYFALCASHQAVRHSGLLTEELLLLCVPRMTAILAQRCEEAAEAYDAATTEIACLASSEPWEAEFTEVRDALRGHTEYCERIELDDRIGSVEKGAALETLLALRRDKAELVQALKEEQLRLLPTLDPFRVALETSYRRLETHRSCRAQGRGVMQHLPSFECTLQSDGSNDCWRPVRSALLFSGWELSTRAAHDHFRELCKASQGARGNHSRPEVEDEVEVVQRVLYLAMASTPVQQSDFFRLASMILKL